MIPKVSVIIPVYNVAEFLDECLQSALNQTLQDIEIIVINDGSTDNSQEIIEKHAAQDKRIIGVLKKNEGLAYARKSGLDRARGEYVFHFDGDDYLPLDALEGLYNRAIESSADIVTGCIYVDFGNGKIELHCYEDFDVITNEEFLTYLFKWTVFHLCGKLIRRTLYTENSIVVLKHISHGEDVFALAQLAYYTRSVAKYHDKGIYYYRQRESSITRKPNASSIKALLESSILVSNFLAPRIKNPLLKDYLTSFTLFHLHYYLLDNYRLSKDNLEWCKKDIQERLSIGFLKNKTLQNLPNTNNKRLFHALLLYRIHPIFGIIGYKFINFYYISKGIAKKFIKNRILNK